MRRKRAACARFAIFARAMLPLLRQHVRWRVMMTCRPSARSSVRRRFAMRRTTAASDWPVTTPWVPPPSLIFMTDDPGPIGSVARFGYRLWPGSSTIVTCADAAGAAAASAAAAATTAARPHDLRAQATLGGLERVPDGLAAVLALGRRLEDLVVVQDPIGEDDERILCQIADERVGGRRSHLVGDVLHLLGVHLGLEDEVDPGMRGHRVGRVGR